MGDDADVGLGLGEHLPIVVVERLDAEALTRKRRAFRESRLTPATKLAGRVLSDSGGVVVGPVGETELIADAPSAE